MLARKIVPRPSAASQAGYARLPGEAFAPELPSPDIVIYRLGGRWSYVPRAVSYEQAIDYVYCAFPELRPIVREQLSFMITVPRQFDRAIITPQFWNSGT
ncbi:hypothetical protein PUNSTDRAFT_54128 [Punctularia strigosozonata HHB-11173 SS5]|uniref:uncharacterized protein n=1 Tax=Punctularia strigosozonata (strain HHB-11173) TaxID=741275 RepID=UPI0004417191|nr:uncharacterized protein PUNSTDRAFT_54128 [Punctularia strigosozonata HHB-11173 SS5]EIN06726.1 hypothetical protein PUNSTDRAFT_54128 [Punctularia strigosozonata HHB-11173 SS5]